MLLETSRRYNPSIDSITFLKDFSYNKEDFAKAGAFGHFCLSNVYGRYEYYVSFQLVVCIPSVLNAA